MTTSVLDRRPAPVSLTAPLLISLAGLAIAVVLGASGALRPAASAPPIALGVAATAPPLIALVLVWRSERFRAWTSRLDLRLLTQLQMWRIAGFALLVLGVSGTLPRDFALPAGIGDLIVALTAPLVASYVVGTRRRWIFLAWTAFGIADLVDALVLGVLHSSSSLGVLAGPVTMDSIGTLPLSLIPTFGVPFALVLHILSLSRIRHWDN